MTVTTKITSTEGMNLKPEAHITVKAPEKPALPVVEKGLDFTHSSFGKASFFNSSKPAEASSTTPVESAPEAQEAKVEGQEETPDRVQRRDAFKRAAEQERKAQATLKEAQAQMAQAKQVVDFFEQAKKDPTLIAKAMGMEQEVFLKTYQDRVFGLDTKAPEVKPEEEVKQRLDKYEQERAAERQAAAQWQAQQAKERYIADKILPEIASNVEKYELLNMDGKEKVAAYMYDMMNAHYQQTGQEFSAAEVAEEMERQLTEDAENRIAQARKVKKLSKHFREEEKARQEAVAASAPAGLKQAPVKTNVFGNTLSDRLGGVPPTAQSPNTPTAPIVASSRDEYKKKKLERTMQKLGINK